MYLFGLDYLSTNGTLYQMFSTIKLWKIEISLEKRLNFKTIYILE
jgi:hypothetical protein